MPDSVLALIGPSGSGKSSIGLALARKLGWQFLDTDREIESELGLSVAEIFAQHGEAEFRKQERKIIENLRDRENLKNQQDLNIRQDLDIRQDLKNREDLNIRQDLDIGQDLKNREDLNIRQDLKSREDLNIRQDLKNREDPKEQKGLVISTGGGLPVQADNFELLESLAILVYLSCPLEVLVTRINRGEKRPLLAGADLESPDKIREELSLRLGKLIAERQSIYNRARYKIDTSSDDVEQLASDIIKMTGLVLPSRQQGKDLSQELLGTEE